MKKIIILFAVISSLSFARFSESPLFPDEDSLKVARAKLIYRNLEYNTTSFDDLKEIWNITDPTFVRVIFNKFIVKNALTYNKKPISTQQLQSKINDLYDGKVFIELRKRYYDNEIEVLRFFTENKTYTDAPRKDYFFDPVEDHIYIKNVLGEKVYEDIKSRFYAHTSLTKTAYSSEQAYNYDIYLSLLDPELMFYNITTSTKNKYLISAFGRWGNDYMAYPGWHYPDYFFGMGLTFIDSLVNNEPYSTYKFELGFGVDARQPTFEFNNDKYGKRLFRTGYNMNVKLTGSPLKLITPKLEKLNLTLEGTMSLSTFKAGDFILTDDPNFLSVFYSIRNYFLFHVEYRDIVKLFDFGWLNAGMGFATHDIHHYQISNESSELIEVKATKQSGFKHMFVADFSLSNSGGLLQHSFGAVFNYNMIDEYGYVGVKSRMMLSNVFGFEFKYFKSFVIEKNSFPFYRLDDYLVFSPVIRINY